MRFSSIAVSCAALLVFTGNALAESCSPNRVDLRGDWGQARFSVELADDARERGQGLMFRESLPSSAGMLFVYDHPQPVAFWMKNTLIPLDMIFVDEFGVVQRIHENAVPHDESLISGGDDILMVLEINGGFARRLGITEGSEMRHPAFTAENIAWGCN